MTEGASSKEQLLDAARRNNLDLFNTVLGLYAEKENDFVSLINDAKDPFGNSSLHLCCKYGSWDVLDAILDYEGVEINEQNTIDGDTPLHLCVKYCHQEPEFGYFIAENLIEVGADPRIKNKANQKPLDLIHSTELENLINLLQGAEIAADNKGLVLDEENAEEIDDGPDDTE